MGDLSGTVKNWVTTASIIIGGGWVLYEWNTLFPKTDAEVTISTADLRARTIGQLSVNFSQLPSGEAPTTASGDYFSDTCAAGDVSSVQLGFPAKILLELKSNAPIPVRVEITDFLLAEILPGVPHVASESAPAIFAENALGAVQSHPLSQDAFISGLNWTNVEPEGQGNLAVLGTAYLSFSCAYGGSSLTPAEYAIGLKVVIQPVARDGTPGEPIDRYFYQVCRLNADGGSSCKFEDAGQNAKDASGGFRVFGQ